MKKDIAIVPGSFDPITNGHLFLIKEAAKEYKTVYVAVMINADKKYMFDIEERKSIAEAATKNISNVKVIMSEGWLWELAIELKADAIVKGYRNEKDFEYEQVMAKFNEEHAPNAKTILLKTDPNLKDLSSTLIREKISQGESLDDFLPLDAIKEIQRILSENIT